MDDNVDAANTTAPLVNMWGHENAIAYDGFAALEVARTFEPEVALLDIGLPMMNGHELAQRMRTVSPTIYLVALTGFGSDTDRDAAHKAGFDIHLTKPVDASPLQTLLATARKAE